MYPRPLQHPPQHPPQPYPIRPPPPVERRNYEALKEEVKLFSNNKEREVFENLADLYAIIVSLDHLEKAYIRDLIPAADYTPLCANLIAQYKTALTMVSEWMVSIEEFMKEYKLVCPAATNRLKIGVPATIEHASASDMDSTKSAKYVAEAVQHFITLMDSLKLNMVAVDQVHPLLSDLMQSLSNVSSLPPNFQGKEKIRDWLITLNAKKASDELTEEQVRQLLFDLENAHNAFYRSLSERH